MLSCNMSQFGINPFKLVIVSRYERQIQCVHKIKTIYQKKETWSERDVNDFHGGFWSINYSALWPVPKHVPR